MVDSETVKTVRGERPKSEKKVASCPFCHSTNLYTYSARIQKRERVICISCKKKFREPEYRYTALPYVKRRNPQHMEIVPQEVVLEKIQNIQNPRNRALAAILYLSGARVTEIVGRLEKGSVITYSVPPLKRKEIKLYELSGEKIVLLENIRVIKGKQLRYRTTPHPVTKEGKFLECAKEHLDSLTPEDIVFKMKRGTAHYLIKKETGYFPHYLRHLRASHLVLNYGFGQHDLMEYFRWEGVNMPNKYVHLRPVDLINKMIKKN